MKKSLSLLLAVALVFSMFGSLAYAQDNLTTAQKYQTLAGLGIFAGINGDPALDQPMTRAQFARVAALIRGLEGIGTPDTRVVTEKPFPDVELDAWYVEEVEAVKKAGLMQGDGVNFNPNSNITVQELAVVTVQLLGLEPVEGAEVEGADDWAAGYIQALLDNRIPFPSNYKQPALRSDLVDAAYVAAEEFGIVAPDQVSVTSAKPVGVQKVEVALNKAVDTSKATLTLKRNNSNVATTTKWAADGRSATLELTNSKIMEGEYTVTLGGLDDAAIANATASFTAENEKVTKLEFVSPSDTVPRSPKVAIEFQALNQYGEPVSLAAGSFTVYSSSQGGANVKKDANGNLYVEIDTSQETPNIGQVSVNVLNTDSQISVNKIFKVGTEPYVAKVELGEVKYSNSEGYLSKQGDKAVIELIQLDQYGHRITTDSGALFNATAHIVPHLPEFNTPQIIDDNNDKLLDVVITLNGDVTATGDYTVNVFGGNTASTTIKVKATAIAATVELDTSVILAEEDEDKYIPIIAYDQDGNRLSANDIVKNYEDGHFKISVSGNLHLEDPANPKPSMQGLLAANPDGQLAVVKAGEHKGKLYIRSVGTKGLANIFVTITPTTANSIAFNKNYQFNIQSKRYPVSLSLETANATKAIPLGGNASSKIKIVAYDQYGEKIKGIIGNIQETSRTVTYDVYVDFVAESPNVIINDNENGTGTDLKTLAGGQTDLSQVLDKEWYFVALNGRTDGKTEVKISLRKINTSTSQVIDNAVSSVTRSMEIIPTDTRLTYSVKAIDTLFAAIDDPAMKGRTGVANDEYYDEAANSKHARKVSVEAKDSAGNTVALPSDFVLGVSSSNSRIVVADNDSMKIIGNKPGTAQIAVTHRVARGGSNTLNVTVEVKSDPIEVVSMSAEKQVIGDANDLDGESAGKLMDLKVKDNYNTEYKATDGPDDNIEAYDAVLGIRYSVSDISGGTVTIDAKSGELTITGTPTFTVTVTAPNGTSISVPFAAR